MTNGGVLTPGTDIRACQFSLDGLRAVRARATGWPVFAKSVPSMVLSPALTEVRDSLSPSMKVDERGSPCTWLVWSGSPL
jgi:hypothetical protein